jgi:hypothetical protein
MHLGRGGFAKVTHLSYLWLYLVKHHLRILSHQLRLPLFLHMVVINPLIHPLFVPIQGDLHNLPLEEQVGPLMLVPLVVLEAIVEEVPLVEVVFLMVMGPQDLLTVDHLSGLDLGMYLSLEHPLVIESIGMDNYLPSWYINRLS